MFSKQLNLTLLTLFICTSVLGQRPFFKDKKVANNIKKHITYLASDELEGRYIATTGERLSAEYIASEFKHIGLVPKGDKGFLQYVPIPNLRMAQANSSMKIGDKGLTLFSDFYPISISANNGRYDGDAINIGFGIQDAGLNQTDYTGKDVKGKAVIINLDIPGEGTSSSKYMSWADAEVRAKYAASQGARVVLFYSKNKKSKPSGTLEKTVAHAGIPVLFVNKDLSEIKTEKIELRLEVMLLIVEAHNVAGYIDNDASHTVIITAHHDHLGGGRGSEVAAENKNMIHPGADNNASGVAGLIEIAREVSKKPKKYANYNYLFVALTGGEQNYMGAKQFEQSKIFGPLEANYSINLDMIGHLDSNQKQVILNGVGTSAQWDKSISATKICKRKISSVETHYHVMENEQKIFSSKGIPSIGVSTGAQSYTNTPLDNPSVINYGGEAYIIRYIYKLMRDLDKSPLLKIAKTPREEELNPSLEVYLGISPDMRYTGDGIKIGAIKDASIASTAGLKAGDIITKIGDQDIVDLNSYVAALSALKPQNTISTIVRRGRDIKTIQLEL